MINAFSDGLGALRRKKRGISWLIAVLLACAGALVSANKRSVSFPVAGRMTGGATFSALSQLGAPRASVQNFYLNNYAITNTVNNYLQGATVSRGSSVGTVSNNILPRK